MEGQAVSGKSWPVGMRSMARSRMTGNFLKGRANSTIYVVASLAKFAAIFDFAGTQPHFPIHLSLSLMPPCCNTEIITGKFK